ncbi:Hypothetical protein POVR2_LOCUS326 [uncultured virus]|nr:Hypothetical protein POVR2_LOCUS326 [uncultured virus]
MASQLVVHPPIVTFEDEGNNLIAIKNDMTIRMIINTIQKMTNRASDLSIIADSFPTSTLAMPIAKLIDQRQWIRHPTITQLTSSTCKMTLDL